LARAGIEARRRREEKCNVACHAGTECALVAAQELTGAGLAAHTVVVVTGRARAGGSADNSWRVAAGAARSSADEAHRIDRSALRADRASDRQVSPGAADARRAALYKAISCVAGGAGDAGGVADRAAGRARRAGRARGEVVSAHARTCTSTRLEGVGCVTAGTSCSVGAIETAWHSRLAGQAGRTQLVVTVDAHATGTTKFVELGAVAKGADSGRATTQAGDHGPGVGTGHATATGQVVVVVADAGRCVVGVHNKVVGEVAGDANGLARAEQAAHERGLTGDAGGRGGLGVPRATNAGCSAKGEIVCGVAARTGDGVAARSAPRDVSGAGRTCSAAQQIIGVAG